MWDWLSGIGDTLSSLWESIKNLPDKIISGIGSLFIPDSEEINSVFTNFTSTLNEKFGFDTSFFESLGGDGKPVEDVDDYYNLPGVGFLNLKFFDSSFIISAVDFFRPFIKGFIVFLLMLYNIKMILGFVRQDAGVVTGKVVNMSKKGD